MASQDPYNLVKQELQEMVSTQSTRTKEEAGFRAKTADDLSRGSNSVLWQVWPENETRQEFLMQLDELEQAIDIAAQDPTRFNLTETELGNRRAWVRNTRRQIHTIQESVRASTDRAHRTDLGAASSRHQENEAFLADQKMEQEMVIRRQDEQLDDMEQAVTRIGNLGRTIHGELTSQHELLDGLDEDVDITSSRIKAAQAKIQDVLKRSGGNCQICMIIGLTLILLILVVIAVEA